MGEVFEEFKPYIEKHQEFEKNMTREYFDLLKEHGVDFFGCSQSCIDRCTNTAYYDINNVEYCL